ncbi:malto-oligosyltrehalose synthase [Candidatus Tenderia electrophaga]|jgi:(1->4)-alpha-D-glucan 1-alpha-D-glucosylmutase|uniref:Malto-oligosyltrehalose synthase n=1 Tax=Candidatus Tenderia electrophaga TaxID=1748243 RepID=A0A0S2TFJ4_9GAMM|nr:malto-oligosyltrehalose synthase [Candidatus Tenderia electrophaga]
MKTRAVPDATYRLQFNRDFTFADATRLIPYLHQLGISHIYASPYLKARSGSAHGYDIVDHNALNPEIGDQADFQRFVDTLKQHDMGQILDIVPNHMGVGGDDNAWWLDVLTHGQASLYAEYFDIDWHPVMTALNNKVLLPFLGDHYGTILESGALQLEFSQEHGSFGVRYYEHLFPIDPRTYVHILGRLKQRLEAIPPLAEDAGAELDGIMAACRALPRRTELARVQRQRRHDEAAACQQRLAAWHQNSPPVQAQLDHTLNEFQGKPEQSKSFDPLHRLLEAQAYRLAYWKVATDEINYRRFFDINDLAGLRVELPEVFRATHGLIHQLIATHQIQGLRLDHLDGLSDPYKYCRDLQSLIGAALGEAETAEPSPFYVIVEKILASHERLPSQWPVAGTTGYESARLLNGLFVYPHDENRLSRLYKNFSGDSADFDETLYVRKKRIINSSLSSELNVLANQLNGIAEADRHSRDFTLHGLSRALTEVAACFPVYRSYVTATQVSEVDRHHVRWAVAQAKRRNPNTEPLIFDFICELLLLTGQSQRSPSLQRRVVQFVQGVQQYTAPVTAKGMEDTAFYHFNRLVSLNDVGFDPRSVGISTAAFHGENKQRLDSWPHAMINTSTHDSKRSEDVRARINVLSEIVPQWRRYLSRWRRLNRHRKRLVDDQHAPNRNDEYLLYQTLVGAWPLDDAAGDLDAFRQRIETYMIKAIREAKDHTSWINPNEAYEAAMHHFVGAVLQSPGQNAFLDDFIPLQRQIARCGLYNSLSQALLKFTMPGVPDIYRGNEVWRFDLVDPDNRRPVDHRHHHGLLQGLIDQTRSDQALTELTQSLMAALEDGRAKLYLTWRILTLRRRHPELFQHGDYLALDVTGAKGEHICAFARRWQDRQLICAAPRWYFRLLQGEPEKLPLGEAVWADTWVAALPEANGRPYRHLFTDRSVQARARADGSQGFAAAELFADFPVAVLINE